MLISRVRSVIARVLAMAPPILAATARVRLWAMAAVTSQAAFA